MLNENENTRAIPPGMGDTHLYLCTLSPLPAPRTVFPVTLSVERDNSQKLHMARPDQDTTLDVILPRSRLYIEGKSDTQRCCYLPERLR